MRAHLPQLLLPKETALSSAEEHVGESAPPVMYVPGTSGWVTSVTMKGFLTRLRCAARLRRPEHHIAVALDSDNEYLSKACYVTRYGCKYTYFLSRQGSPRLMLDVTHVPGHGVFVTMDTQVGINGRTAKGPAPRRCRCWRIAGVAATRWLARAKFTCVPDT